MHEHRQYQRKGRTNASNQTNRIEGEDFPAGEAGRDAMPQWLSQPAILAIVGQGFLFASAWLLPLASEYSLVGDDISELVLATTDSSKRQHFWCLELAHWRLPSPSANSRKARGDLLPVPCWLDFMGWGRSWSSSSPPIGSIQPAMSSRNPRRA